VSAQITVTVAGSERSVDQGTTAGQLFEGERTVVVARVGGELRDLAHVLVDGDVVQPVAVDSPDGLDVLRHSCAHVLAQAVQQADPGARLGIGPPITDGFYYDFDVETPFTPEDLKRLEKAMQRIINTGQTFHRRTVTDDAARVELAGEPYKLELIGLKGGSVDDEAEGAAVEVGGAELTIYDNLDRQGEVAWGDLCRGPHLPDTKIIGNAFKLMRTAAAYWRGSEANPQLQRIYGTAWPSKADLTAYLERLAEAERRDHRRLGVELDLYSFLDELGSGLPVFHPRGGVIKREMEDYVRQRHVDEGFEYVGTPHIAKEGLFRTSGHLPYYADGMFPPMQMEGSDYYLKAMNCPMHNLIFRSRGRSYRELPLRLFEFGAVYRNEKSGVVHGLTHRRRWTTPTHMSPPSRHPGRSSTCSPSCWACSRTSAWTTSTWSCPPGGTRRSSSAARSSGKLPPGCSSRWGSTPDSSWCPTPAARRSTGPRSRCRRGMPSDGAGRCRPCRWTSSSRSGSGWSTRRPTDRGSAR
jgi:threonyl-tRNA synthetase